MDANAVVQATELAGSVASHDLSLWGLFIQADLVVKLVMIMLMGASIWSWAIIFDKWVTLKNATFRAGRFENYFWSGESLEKLYNRIKDTTTDPMARTFCAGMHEWKLSLESGQTALDENLHAGLQMRIDRAMSTSISREMGILERYMSFLGTVGSTAPFIGLFGTVWGIMNSFSAIAGSNNTSLAVVAPGIAEALFATAMGLVAAIPAVIAYNKFNTDLNRYNDRLEGFTSDFSSILSRHFETARE